MSDLIRRLQRLNYSIHSNGYKDSAIFEAIDAIQQAHREGWEQAKREADSLLLDLIDVVLESKPVVQSARRAIAAMEYGGKAND